MKEILHVGGHVYYLLVRGNVGYVVITSNLKLELYHTVCCWGNPPTVEIAQAIHDHRGLLEKIVMCSNEGEGCAKQFGADASFSDLNDSEVSEIKGFVQADNTLADLIATQKESEQRETALRKKAQRIGEVRALLGAFRYQDARDHCQVHGLNYEEFLEQVKNS